MGRLVVLRGGVVFLCGGKPKVRLLVWVRLIVFCGGILAAELLPFGDYCIILGVTRWGGCWSLSLFGGGDPVARWYSFVLFGRLVVFGGGDPVAVSELRRGTAVLGWCVLLVGEWAGEQSFFLSEVCGHWRWRISGEVSLR